MKTYIENEDFEIFESRMNSEVIEDAKNNKDDRFYFRVTKEEKMAIKKMATDSGLTISGLIRSEFLTPPERIADAGQTFTVTVSSFKLELLRQQMKRSGKSAEALILEGLYKIL